MDRVVLPLVKGVPPSARLNGLLLLGPPGVGKTFALHAVQKLAKDWCFVEVEEVSIPELLTEDRPLDYLRKTLDRMKLPTRASLPCMRFVLLDEVDALGNEHKVHPVQVLLHDHVYSVAITSFPHYYRVRLSRCCAIGLMLSATRLLVLMVLDIV